MTLENEKQIEDNRQYRFTQSADSKTLLLKWKHVAGLTPKDFRMGIAGFSGQCKAHKPDYAVIDTTALDQSSPAVSWLRALSVEGELEDYQTWWMRDVVPDYHDAGVVCLAIGTGDPNAPGEVGGVPGVNFKMGYFPDLDAALAWQPK